MFRLKIAHLYGNDGALKEFRQLAVGKIIRFHNRHPVPPGRHGSHGQEQRSLGSRRQDHVFCRINFRAGKRGELLRHIHADGGAAAVLRVSLSPALQVPGVKGFLAPRKRLKGIHIPVGEIHRRPRQPAPPQIQLCLPLQLLLTRGAVHPQLRKFLSQQIHFLYLPLLFCEVLIPAGCPRVDGKRRISLIIPVFYLIIKYIYKYKRYLLNL